MKTIPCALLAAGGAFFFLRAPAAEKAFLTKWSRVICEGGVVARAPIPTGTGPKAFSD